MWERDHVIIRTIVKGRRIRMTQVAYLGWQEVVERLQEDDKDFGAGTLHACQLLDPRIASEINERTDPAGLESIRVPGLEILRLYPELFFEELRPEHLFYPGRNEGSFYIYWMMLPPVQRIRHPILFEEMITMQILLITGTTSSHNADIQVRAQCPYRELLYILKEFFRNTGMASWSEVSKHIVEDEVINHESMKMYLCPADLGPTDRSLLKATCASQEGLLDYALHRLILYDWFADLASRK
jgi:hypothetical protein